MGDLFAAVYEWFVPNFQKPQVHIPIETENQLRKRSDYSDVIDAIGDLFDLEEAEIIDPKLYRRRKRDERKKATNRRPKLTISPQDQTSETSSDSKWPPVLVKCPGSVVVTGPLATMNVNTVFETIRQEMKQLYSTSHGNAKVIKQYIHCKFNRQLIINQQADLAFVHLIQCHRAAEDILGNKEYYNETTRKMRKLPDYNVKNVMLLHCMVNYHLLYKALSDKNYGQAERAVLTARNNLQSCATGSWTAGQFELEGGLQNMFAYIWPSESKTYHEKSFQSFEKAREHFIEHDGHNEGSYSWVYCLFQMQTCLLQLPLRKNIQFVLSNPSEKRMALLHRFDIDLAEIIRAEQIIQKAEKEFLKCDEKYTASFRYNILLAEIGLELRRAQILRRFRKHQLALDAVNKGLNCCNNFLSCVNADKNAYYLAYIEQWVKDYLMEVLEELRLQLYILCEKRPQQKSTITARDIAREAKMVQEGVQGLMHSSDGSSLESINGIESDVT